MFRDLLDNAIRYAHHRVLVTAAAGPDGTIVEIADDGPGIPASERERVFGRFARLDASREPASRSAGLGLAIAREIAAAHGATIVLTEAPGGGTLAAVAMGGTKSAGGEITAGPAHRSGQNELIAVPAPRQPTGSALTPMLTSYQAAR